MLVNRSNLAFPQFSDRRHGGVVGVDRFDRCTELFNMLPDFGVVPCPLHFVTDAPHQDSRVVLEAFDGLQHLVKLLLHSFLIGVLKAMPFMSQPDSHDHRQPQSMSFVKPLGRGLFDAPDAGRVGSTIFQQVEITQSPSPLHEIRLSIADQSPTPRLLEYLDLIQGLLRFLFSARRRNRAPRKAQEPGAGDAADGAPLAQADSLSWFIHFSRTQKNQLLGESSKTALSPPERLKFEQSRVYVAPDQAPSLSGTDRLSYRTTTLPLQKTKKPLEPGS